MVCRNRQDHGFGHHFGSSTLFDGGNSPVEHRHCFLHYWACCARVRNINIVFFRFWTRADGSGPWCEGLDEGTQSGGSGVSIALDSSIVDLNLGGCSSCLRLPDTGHQGKCRPMMTFLLSSTVPPQSTSVCFHAQQNALILPASPAHISYSC